MKNNHILISWTMALAIFTYSCQSTNQTALTEEDKAVYLEKGKQIATATFTALSGQLQQAIRAEGVPGAIEYCNLAALPLVDSLSKVHHATIRRTSTKVRNPADHPTDAEALVLQSFRQKASAGQELKPLVQALGDRGVAFYAPIKVNEFCLQCHGKPGETLSLKNQRVIQQFYPDDQAIGYSAGDLRGIWSIQFIY